MVCDCSQSDFDAYPDLTVHIGGQPYTMNRFNYMEVYGSMCLIKVMSMDFSGWGTSFWILGLNFFHNYYTVFDQENGRIGFAESKLSSLSQTVALNNTSIEESSSMVLPIAIAVAVLGFLAGAFVIQQRRKGSALSAQREQLIQA